MLKIEKNVINFLNRSSYIVGNFYGEIFSLDNHHEIDDYSISSPIEQILYSALKTLRETNFIEKSSPVDCNGKWYVVGLGIHPQTEIGKYRCDFEVIFGTPVLKDGTQRIINKVFVECDSQQFHERTESERRYEKARDRFIQSKGYKILHYTGKEIIENPFQIAAEIIHTVTGDDLEEIKDSIINYDQEEQ